MTGSCKHQQSDAKTAPEEAAPNLQQWDRSVQALPSDANDDALATTRHWTRLHAEDDFVGLHSFLSSLKRHQVPSVERAEQSLVLHLLQH